MKKVTILILNFYQLFISPMIRGLVGVNNACKYNPSCSQYAKEKVLENGVITGLYLSAKRLASCQPFSRS